LKSSTIRSDYQILMDKTWKVGRYFTQCCL